MEYWSVGVLRPPELHPRSGLEALKGQPRCYRFLSGDATSGHRASTGAHSIGSHLDRQA